MSAATAAVLDSAANVIRRNGWHKGGMFADVSGKEPKDCPVCPWGAVSIVICGRPDPLLNRDFSKTLDAIESLGAYLKLRGKLAFAVPYWNDQSDRTAEQVIAALEGAARAEREGAS